MDTPIININLVLIILAICQIIQSQNTTVAGSAGSTDTADTNITTIATTVSTGTIDSTATANTVAPTNATARINTTDVTYTTSQTNTSTATNNITATMNTTDLTVTMNDTTTIIAVSSTIDSGSSTLQSNATVVTSETTTATQATDAITNQPIETTTTATDQGLTAGSDSSTASFSSTVTDETSAANVETSTSTLPVSTTTIAPITTTTVGAITSTTTVSVSSTTVAPSTTTTVGQASAEPLPTSVSSTTLSATSTTNSGTVVLQDCPSLSRPYYGEMSCTGTSDGDVCSFKCDPAYGLNGASSSECVGSSGEWSEEVPKCEPITCQELEQPANGSIQCSGTSFNDTCTSQCDEGFGSNSTSLTSLCTGDGSSSSGEWENQVICEVITCPPMQQPSNGNVNCSSLDNYSIGSTCALTCATGYISGGPFKSECISNGTGIVGTWNGTLDSCQEITCTSPIAIQIPYGYTTCPAKDVYVEGDSCEYHCDEGYGLSGSSVLSCVDDVDMASGKWNNTSQPCKEIICPALSDLQNGKVECTGDSYGENCTRSCNYGYGLTFDPVVTTCIGDGSSTLGSWYSINDTHPTCENVTYYDFELTFSDTYNADLSDVSSTYYSSYAVKVQLALESLLGSMQVASDSSAGWTFSPGSTIATAANVPVLYVSDTTDVDEELNSNLQAGSVVNLMTATAKSSERCTSSSCPDDGSVCTPSSISPGFTCSCDTGYIDKNPSQSGTSCAVDPCVGETICQHGGRCTVNEDFQPTCICPDGYWGDECQHLNGTIVGLLVGFILLLMLFIALISALIYKRKRMNSKKNLNSKKSPKKQEDSNVALKGVHNRVYLE